MEKTPDYMRGFIDGYLEGKNAACEQFREQIQLAYVSRPIEYVVPVSTIDDGWGNTRTIVHEMGQ